MELLKTILKKIVLIGLVILLALTVRLTQRAIDRHKEIKFVDKRPVFLPKGEVLKWMSMGYRGLMGDWLWIRSVLYYGRRVIDHDNPYLMYAEKKGDLEGLERHYELHHREVSVSAEAESALDISEDIAHILYQGESKGLVDYIYPMLDRVTTVDPHFIFPYIFGGIYVMLDTGEIDEAQKLLKKGYKANPNRWEFPFYLGWIEWMYQKNLEETMEYLSEAVGKEGCAHYVGDLLTGLSRNLGRLEFTRLYLEGLLKSSDNPEIRERIEELLQQISLNPM